MIKIFKYEINPETRLAMVPVGKVLRVDYVDDGFYKGHFVWIIVNTENLTLHETHFPIISQTAAEPPDPAQQISMCQLGVQEKQQIHIRGFPQFAKAVDGKMWVYYKHRGDSHEMLTHRIAVYKTGQVIDIPPERLTYIGMCKLFIIQELCLYTFVTSDRP